jgi:hypothetical protein
MTRLLIPLLICAAIMPAAEGKGHDRKIGTVLGRQVVDAGHILEANAVTGQSGVVLIRWGDIDNVIGKDGGKGSGFAWSGSATGTAVALVKVVAFEDGSRANKPPVKTRNRRGDRLTGDGYAGSVNWETRTTSAWDGVLVKAASGSTLASTSGPATLNVKVP